MKQWLPYFCFLVSVLSWSQQIDVVNYKKAKVSLEVIPRDSLVIGAMALNFNILKPIDSIYIDAQNMAFKHVVLNDTLVKWYNDGKKLWIINKFKTSEDNKLTFSYSAHPKKALYFIGWTDLQRYVPYSNYIKNQVWTQGQGKYTSNWLPSIDDMNDKIEFDLSISFDKAYEVVANGRLRNKQINNSTITWHYDMKKPMSSYLVALAIGKYSKKVIESKSGIPIELYYYPEDSLKFEPTYRYTKQIFDFLETEIGVPYPWQNYKQVPVKDFLYAGMENTSLTIFSDRYVADSIAFVDRNYVNVNAHELAHQWFGDLVTETSGVHHWLQEGFATYYALLAEKKIFGDDYYNWQLYEYAQELLHQDQAGLSTSLLDPNSSSTTFYKKGAWVLHLLREKVGNEFFKKAVKIYLEKHQFKNVQTDDFFAEVEKESNLVLSEFIQNNLIDTDFFNNHLKEWSNDFLKSEELIIDYHNFCKAPIIDHYFSNKNEFWKAHFIENALNDSALNSIPFIKSLLNSDDFHARQQIAKHLSVIPIELKSDYQSLLKDPSYFTKEIALLNLWQNFPEDRAIYFDELQNIQGFNDKNIRILWLTLALITEDYQPFNKKVWYEELIGYTMPEYHFEIRQNAFQYLNSIGACNEVCQQNLLQASKHPVWQFSKLAKDLLKQLE